MRAGNLLWLYVSLRPESFTTSRQATSTIMRHFALSVRRPDFDLGRKLWVYTSDQASTSRRRLRQAASAIIELVFCFEVYTSDQASTSRRKLLLWVYTSDQTSTWNEKAGTTIQTFYVIYMRVNL
jgi:hypothetical protein